MARQVVGIEKSVLRWARETAGLSPEAVAALLKLDAAKVLAWEAGQSAPTYAQLEKLAYSIYRRPLAVFFLPAPPTPRAGRSSVTTRRLTRTGLRLQVLKAPVAREYKPDRVSAPGDSLQDLLAERGLTAAQLARRMGRRTADIHGVIAASRVIDAQMAAEFESVLGTPAQFWLNRERRYREFLAEKDASSGSRA